MKQAAAILLFAVAGALVASGCQATSPYAVKVNGTTISQTTLLREVHALASSTAWVGRYDQQAQQAAQSGQSLPVVTGGKGSVTTAFTDLVLSFAIRAALVHAEFTRRHLQPNQADLGQGPNYALLLPTPGQPPIALPKWLTQEYTTRGVEQSALDRSLGPVASDTQAVTNFYNSNPQDFITAQCTSQILVSSERTAIALRARLQNGADFKALARQYSLDAASAAKGGSLGCTAPSLYGAGFEQVALSTGVGQVSQPVHTSAGWSLIKVDSQTKQPLDSSLQAQIQQSLQGTEPVINFITQQNRTLRVAVNPAFGTWEPVTGQVLPPAAPGPSAGVPTSAPPAP